MGREFAKQLKVARSERGPESQQLTKAACFWTVDRRELTALKKNNE